MTVRSLSSTSFWVEMPLSLQTCLLVWHAMFASGLRQGRINSYREEHFSPLYDWQPHLVEGLTPQGFLDPKATIQAKLSEREGGTLVELSCANTRGELDFGSSRAARRRVLPRMRDFLQSQPANWHAPQLVAATQSAPIASPHDTGDAIPVELPAFGDILPIRTRGITVEDWKRFGVACLHDWKGLLAFVVLAVVATRFHLWYLWPFFCILNAGIEWWGIYKKRRPLQWWSCWPSLCVGFYYAWPLLRSWL